MVSIISDPKNPDRLFFSITVSGYLDRLLDDVLSDQIAEAIRIQAIHDLTTNKTVKHLVAVAASEKILKMLGEMTLPVIPDCSPKVKPE